MRRDRVAALLAVNIEQESPIQVEWVEERKINTTNRFRFLSI